MRGIRLPRCEESLGSQTPTILCKCQEKDQCPLNASQELIVPRWVHLQPPPDVAQPAALLHQQGDGIQAGDEQQQIAKDGQNIPRG